MVQYDLLANDDARYVEVNPAACQLLGYRREELLAELKKERTQLKVLAETLEQRVNERTEQVRNLASELALAEQRERHHIAQVLHDDTQQMLVALQMNMQLIGEQATPEIRSQLKEAAVLTAEVIDGLRDLSIELRPPVKGLASIASVNGPGCSVASWRLVRLPALAHGLR